MVNGALFADDAGVPDRAFGGNQDANGQVSLEYGSFSQEFLVQEFQLALIVFDGSEYGLLAERIGDDFSVRASGADVLFESGSDLLGFRYYGHGLCPLSLAPQGRLVHMIELVQFHRTGFHSDRSDRLYGSGRLPPRVNRLGDLQ